MWTIVVQFFRDVRQAIERLYADDGPVLAAATAYYLGLSFFPLLLVLTAGIGWFLRYTHPGQSAQQEVLHSIATAASEQLADYVAQTLDMVQDRSSINGPLGLATMLITALAAFTQLDSAFKRIWRVADTGSKSIFLQALAILAARGRAFLVLLGLGALVVLVFLAGMVLTAVESQTNAVMPAGRLGLGCGANRRDDVDEHRRLHAVVSPVAAGAGALERCILWRLSYRGGLGNWPAVAGRIHCAQQLHERLRRHRRVSGRALVVLLRGNDRALGRRIYSGHQPP